MRIRIYFDNAQFRYQGESLSMSAMSGIEVIWMLIIKIN